MIAVISQVYDNVVAEQIILKFRTRAQMSKEYYTIKHFLNLSRDFKVLVLQNDSDRQLDEDSEFLGFVQTIKNYMSKQNQILMSFQSDLTSSLRDEMNAKFDFVQEKMKEKQFENMSKFDTLQTQVKNVTNLVEVVDNKIETMLEQMQELRNKEK